MKSYPHLYVLKNDGTLLHTDNLTSLEAEKGYDRAKLLAFLAEWAPKS